MPKEPTHYSIVREVREILGWTQSALAERIGTAPITINRIENGTLKLSRKLALRICWTTGVHYRDLMANKTGVPQTRLGPLTKDVVDASEAKAAALTPQEDKWLVDNAAWRAEMIYKALKETAMGRRKIWSADAAIMASFDDIEQELGIAKVVDRLTGRRRS